MIKNYKQHNDKEREFYSKDFTLIKILLDKVRLALISDEPINIDDIDLSQIIEMNDFSDKFVYITLFQEGLKSIRWGTCRSNFEVSLKRIIEKLKEKETFSQFCIENKDKCRIMLEYVTEKTPVAINEVTQSKFSEYRFEPGVTGIELKIDKQVYSFMPTDAWTNSMLYFNRALNILMRKTYLKNLSNKVSERIIKLQKTDYKCFLTKSRAFITYKNELYPLYRGNALYNYSSGIIKEQALNGADWIMNYQQDNGKFLYYYDAKEDNYVDHEHPTRTEDNLYYNDLRHCGGCITLLRAYELTKDEKYLKSCQKGLDYIKSISVDYDEKGEVASYVFLNKKAKLGGTGLILAAMMKYRIITGDKSNDEQIKKYVRHLISRVHDTGEMLGYYIHPEVQSGRPLINMTQEERKNTFSFYYPGEALLGLALFVKKFEYDDDLLACTKEKCEKALDWLVEERPKIYSDMFQSLPSDAWLMQAIEEWVDVEGFNKKSYIDFVFNDAKAMIEHSYKKDDSPFLDYEGGYYYNYGDVFYPDGARSEGLIAAYYLAEKLGENDFANEVLNACRLAAKSQMILSNNEINTYAHKNPQKSFGAIRFKPTRQWVRVDTIQHVACFYLRLYFAQKDI